jgi:hypothetical protein
MYCGKKSKYAEEKTKDATKISLMAGKTTKVFPLFGYLEVEFVGLHLSAAVKEGL